MKKKLLLVRHAKAKSGDFEIKDFDRPLSQKGIDEALEMGQQLFQGNIFPDGIISSPALRAISTAKSISISLGFEKENIILEPNIYEASLSKLLHVVNNLDNHLCIVALFGHNPGLSMLADYLTDADIIDIPTCGMAMIEFEVDAWKMISGGTGNLLWLKHP
jgi:phosphohistidine phosphatase